MRKVALYPILEKEGYFYLNVPKGAQPVDLHEGEEGLKVALLVNDNASLENKKFLITEEDQVIEESPPAKLVSVGLFTRKNRVYFLFEVK